MSEDIREFVTGQARISKHRPNGGHYDLSGMGLLDINAHFVRNTKRVSRLDKLSMPAASEEVVPRDLSMTCREKIGSSLSNILEDYRNVERRGDMASVYIDGTDYDKIEFDKAGWSIRSIACYPTPKGLLFSINVTHGVYKALPTAHWDDKSSVYGCYFLFVPDNRSHVQYRSYVTGEDVIDFPWIDDVRSAIWTVDDRRVEYPVAAAILVGSDVVAVDRPGRHHTVISTQEYQDLKKTSPESEIVQGFLSNHGNFLCRKRAMYLTALHRVPIIREDGGRIDVKILKSRADANGQRHDGHGGNTSNADETSSNFTISSMSLFSEDLW